MMDRPTPNDDGITLVELLVYMFLLAIIGAMVVMFIINGFRSQTNVTETTQRNGDAQNAARALEYDIRYSEDIRVYDSGNTVRTRTWVGDPKDGDYVCRGWHYDGGSGVLRRSTSSTEVRTGSVADWPIYIESVAATRPFSEPVDGGPVEVVFSAGGGDAGVATKVATTIYPRPQSASGGVPTCFP